MRSATVSLLVAGLVVASAQSQSRSKFGIYPDIFGIVNNQGVAQSTSFTDRGSSNQTGQEVELLQELPANTFAHIGGTDLTTCTMDQYFYVAQDQDLSTPDNYSAIVRGRDASGVGPDVVGQPIALTAPLQFPSGTGAAAFSVTLTFTQPVALPCVSDYFFGVRIGANVNWPQDGGSMHMAEYTQGQLGDNPRSAAPSIGWSVVTGQAAVSHTQVWNTWLGASAPVLNIGGNDPNTTRYVAGTTGFGAAGIYPETSGAGGRVDGLTARIVDEANAGGMAFLFLGVAIGQNPLPIPNIAGALTLDPVFFMPAGQGPIALDPLTNNTVGVVPFVPPNVIPMSAVGTKAAMIGVSTGPGFANASFTNTAVVEL